MEGSKLLLWIVLLCAVCSVNTQNSCTTPNGGEGDCKSIYDCPKLFALADNPTRTAKETILLQNSKCPGAPTDFCCPKPKPPPPAQVTTCYTPDGIRGRCVSFKQCTQILRNDRNFIMNSLCDAEGEVCCGTSRPQIKRGVCTASAFPPDPASDCCGIQVSSENRIVGGNETSIDEYPWVAIIKFQNGRELCGASLISSKYVLTAAHCVYDNKTNRPVSVTLGEYNKDSENDCVYIGNQPDCADPPVTIPIEQVINHPAFNPTDPYLRNDIALIRLARAAPYTEFIRPICLPSAADDIVQRPPINFRLTAAGWGATDEKHPTTSLKLKVTLPFVNAWECSRIYNSLTPPTVLWSYQLCAGGERLKDSCTGDSGGPLMYDVSNKHQVIGIVSFGSADCGVKDVPGVYTKVSAYNTWIRRNIKP